jgi:hypothetical protein
MLPSTTDTVLEYRVLTADVLRRGTSMLGHCNHMDRWKPRIRRMSSQESADAVVNPRRRHRQCSARRPEGAPRHCSRVDEPPRSQGEEPFHPPPTPAKPSRPTPGRQGRASGKALHLAPWARPAPRRWDDGGGDGTKQGRGGWTKHDSPAHHCSRPSRIRLDGAGLNDNGPGVRFRSSRGRYRCCGG